MYFNGSKHIIVSNHYIISGGHPMFNSKLYNLKLIQSIPLEITSALLWYRYSSLFYMVKFLTGSNY